jgi:hypothetical protein
MAARPLMNAPPGPLPSSSSVLPLMSVMCLSFAEDTWEPDFLATRCQEVASRITALAGICSHRFLLHDSAEYRGLLKKGDQMLKSQKPTIRRSFLAAAIVVAGPVLGIAGLAGSASALPAAKPAPAALSGISCTSATFCMAVGSTSVSMSMGVAAEDWTGAWHRLSIPKPGGVSYVGLGAVSCPSATECVAVGEGTNKSGNSVPVAETWTHSGGWKAGKPVVPGGNGDSALNAISCPSTSLCFAAGAADEFGTVVADQLPLVERWTPRGGWTRVTLPRPRGSSENALYGISCKASTQCAAVGSYSTSTTQYGLIEQLKGTTWTASTAPKSGNGELNAVSCPSASLCVAVGALQSGHNLAERWSAGKWTASEPVAPAGAHSFPGLSSVSCASTTHCVALGFTVFASSASRAFIDTLSGTTWTKTAQTGSAGFTIGQLNDVSCFSTSTRATSCALIGDTTAVDATQRPLSAFLTGSKWHVVSTV